MRLIARGLSGIVIALFSGIIYFTPNLLIKSPQALYGATFTPAWHVGYDAPGAFVGISCISSTQCMAVGTEGYVAVTTNGGASFSVSKVLPFGSLLMGVSCVSNTCYVVGQENGSEGVVLKTTNFGLGWSNPDVLNFLTILNSISCVSSTSCVAVGAAASAGAIVVTTDGQTFTAQTVPSGVESLSSVSCSSASYCVAVGDSVSGSTTVGTVLYSTNFSSFSLGTAPASNMLMSVSCITNSQFCYASGVYNNAGIIISSTQTGNFSIDSTPSGPSAINAITCLSSLYCIAVSANGFVLETTQGPTGWTNDLRAPGNISGYLGINCASSSMCVLSGQESSGLGEILVLSLSTSGNTYYQTSINGDLSILSLSCPSATQCFGSAFGSNGAEIVTSSTALSSVSVTNVTAAYYLLGISCPALNYCMAVGDNSLGAPVVVVTTNGGLTWINQSQNVGSGVGLLTSVSCVSTTTCYASDVNGNIITTTNFGSSFTVTPLPIVKSGGTIYSISCVSASVCFAAGSSSSLNGVVYLTTNGTNWSLSLADQQVTNFYAINCVNASTSVNCLVGGGNSQGAQMAVTTNTGSSWSSVALPQNLSAITSISCTTSSNCSASDQSGVIISTQNMGATWQVLSGPYSIETLSAISCVSSYQCFAAGGATILSSTPVINSISPSSGLITGGNSVTIYGSGFTNVTSVSFGSNTTTSFTVNNDSQLVVTVPASSSAGFVSVTVNNSVSGPSPNVSGDGYIYISGGDTVEISPVRIVDTRSGATDPPTYAGDRLGPNGSLTIPVVNANNDGVPSGAQAVILNITAVSPTAYSYLTVWPAGVARPNSSVVNFSPYEFSIATLTEVPLGQNGSISVYNALGSVDVLVDVEGYVEPSTPTPSTFVSFGPQRFADTRTYSGNNYQGAGQYLQAGSSMNVQIAGYSSIPASGVVGVVINVTVTDANEVGGYLVIYPANSPAPQSSALNYSPGMTVANQAIVKLGSNGAITIGAQVSGADVIVDVYGYFISSTSGHYYYPVSPNRIVDSRAYTNNFYQLANTYLTSSQSYSFTVAGYSSDGIPTSAVAVTGVATVIYTQNNGGYLTFYPSGSSVPTSSNINWSAGEIISNMVTVGLGSSNLSVFVGVSKTDLVFDVTGYYQ